MAFAEQNRTGFFSLRFDRGLGRLVLRDRRISDLFSVDDLQLALRQVPSRLDTSSGVERFRHQRAELASLKAHIEDHELGRFAARQSGSFGLRELDVWAMDGDLVLAGETDEGAPIPFVARARIESAPVGTERAVVVSIYQVRAFGPSRWSAVQLAQNVLDSLGLGAHRSGPTVAVLDPLTPVLMEVFSELGWKLPDRERIQLKEIRCEAGRVSLLADTGSETTPALRELEAPWRESAQGRRFLLDYEAKTFYASTEGLIESNELERAISTYERQLELHPDHPFLVVRLLQLQSTLPGTLGECAALARSRLARYPDDVDALAALGGIYWRRSQPVEAADVFERIALIFEKRGDAIDAAQARCGVAVALAEADPERAIRALESALSLRRRLPGALRFLATLQGQAGDWAAALQTRERLLATEESASNRREQLLELGRTAIIEADDAETGAVYYQRVLDTSPDDVDALVGFAEAQDRLGQPLRALRALDRAGRLLQERGDTQGAADVMVQLGHLWAKQPEEGPATAALRYRQALLLAPGHAGALMGIAETAIAQGEPDRARTALEDLLHATPERGTQISRAQIYLRLGQILDTFAGDPVLAATYLQKAMDGDDDVAERALVELESLHTRGGRWDDVARVLEMGVGRASSSEQKVDRMMRLASIVDQHQNDATRAAAILEAAHQIDPRNVSLLTNLAQLHRQRNAYDKLAETLALMVRLTDNPEALSAHYVERADLLRVHLNRTEESIENYTLALGCAPKNEDALEGLIDIYRERERFAELAGVLERLAQLQNGEPAGRTWLELGRLQSRHMGQKTEAIDSLDAALELMPDDPEVLRLLAVQNAGLDRLDRAVRLYQRLARIYESEGYDEPAAIFHTQFADVLSRLARVSEAMSQLEIARLRDPQYIPAYELAQDVLLREGRFEDIVSFFTIGLEDVTNNEARRFLTERAGRLLWREMRKPADAGPLLEEALRHEPENAVLRQMCLEVATAQGDWPRVADLLRTQLDDARSEERPAMLVNLAQLAYHELDRREEALQLVSAALVEDAEFVPALALQGEWAHEVGDWRKARDAYTTLLDLDLDDQILGPDDLFRLAGAELHLGEAMRALPRLVALRDDGHEFQGQLEAFLEAYLQLRSPDGIVKHIGDIDFEQLEDQVKLSLYRRAARVLQESSQYHPSARVYWESVLGIVEQDGEAVAGLAHLDAASRAAQAAEVAGVTKDSEVSPSAFVSGEEDILAAVDAIEMTAADVRARRDQRSEDGGMYVDQPPVNDEIADQTPENTGVDDHANLVAENREAGDHANLAAENTDVADRPNLAESNVSVAEVTRKVENAASSSGLETHHDKEADELDDFTARLPEFDSAEDDLPPARVLPTVDEIESPAEALVTLRSAIDVTADPLERARLWLDLAEMQRDRLHQPEEAIPAFMSAIEEGRVGGEVWLEAMEALEDLYTLRGDWDALVALYDRRIQADFGNESETWLVKASIYRNAGRLEEAIESAEKALPLGERAVELLVNLLTEVDRPEEAAEHLLKGIDDCDSVQKGHRYWQAADLMKEVDWGQAVKWMMSAGQYLNDSEFIGEFVEFARQVGDADALVQALQMQAKGLPQTANAPIRSSALLLEAAILLIDHLEDAHRGRSLLEESLKAWPENLEALDRLAETLEMQKDAEGLAKVWRKQVELSLPGPHRGQKALRLAELYFEELDLGEDALTLTQMALEDLSDDLEVAQAESLLERLGKEPYESDSEVELASETDPDVPTEMSPEEVAKGLVDRAEHLWAEGTAVADAIALLEEALSVAPQVYAAYELLEEIYGATEDFNALSMVLERHAAALGPSPEKGHLLAWKAGVAWEHLSDASSAWRSIREVLGTESSSMETTVSVLELLEDIEVDTQSFEEVCEVLTHRIERTQDIANRARLFLLRAEIAWTQLQDGFTALTDFALATDCDPELTRAWLGLGWCALRQEDFARATLAFEAAIRLGLEQNEADEVDEALGAIEVPLTKLGRLPDISVLARQVLQIFPDSRVASAALVDPDD